MTQRIISALAVTLPACLCGCAYLPSSAPTALELTSAGTSQQRLNYFLIDLDPRVAAALAEYRRPGLASTFGVGGYQPALVLRPGDTVAITIFEVGGPVSLFGPPPTSVPTPPSAASLAQPGAVAGHATTLPSQVIELDGTVQIPFGGRVKIAGLTPQAAERAIERTLAGKALEPHAVVTPVATSTNIVTVAGDVGHPGPVPLSLRGERVLDVIATAGGAKYESFDCDVQLIRGGRVATVNLRRIVDTPSENVRVQPGDTVFVSFNPRSYSVLGSAQKASHYNFEYQNLSLAEAIARSGGGTDNITDIGAIYLMRYEPRDLIRQILPPGDPRQASADALSPDGNYPVAYHVNLREAQGYFLSQAVQMRDKDTLLMTDAQGTELAKLLNIARGFTGIYFDLKRTYYK
ncbi:MAG: polysaccharide export protein [Acetobacteraceae bacterium]|nr:polysaccharide export protein [Acetobacteraceae bacterium]